MDLNKVMIIGRLTRDPEVRTIPSGQTVATFSIATNRQWKNQQGEQQSQTEYHNVVAWRRLAEICGQYLSKGRQVYIEGYLQTRSWDDQSGTKRYRTEIVADNMIMLGNKGDAPMGGGGAPARPAAPAAPAGPAAGPSNEPSYQPVNDGGAPQPQPASDETISIEDIPF